MTNNKTVNNISKYLNTLNSNDTQDSVSGVAIADLKVDHTLGTDINYDLASYWSPWSGSNVCPKCGGHTIEVNDYVVLTSNPPQAQLRCKDCGHLFGSGAFNSENTNRDALDKMWQHDQSILGKPQVGDWPPGPQIGDWWPTEQEPPSYPDVYIPRKDSPMGWICPKCGRCYAPHVRGCSHCNASEIKISY